MYGSNLRPYGEYFAEDQAVTAAAVAGNQAGNNPQRLDAALGGCAIRVATPKKDGALTVAANATVTLTVLGAKTGDGTPVVLGTAVYTNDTGAAKTFLPDELVCEFVLSEACLRYPFVSVRIGGSAAMTGSVDIFPHYVSRAGRG